MLMQISEPGQSTIKEACKPFRKQRPELSITRAPSVRVQEWGLTW